MGMTEQEIKDWDAGELEREKEQEAADKEAKIIKDRVLRLIFGFTPEHKHDTVYLHGMEFPLSMEWDEGDIIIKSEEELVAIVDSDGWITEDDYMMAFQASIILKLSLLLKGEKNE